MKLSISTPINAGVIYNEWIEWGFELKMFCDKRVEQKSYDGS
jgi:hypothetical protein